MMFVHAVAGSEALIAGETLATSYEVVADATNPKGFGEPRWLVDYHNELLSSVDVVIAQELAHSVDLLVVPVRGVGGLLRNGLSSL